jgi:hypothetical protein
MKMLIYRRIQKCHEMICVAILLITAGSTFAQSRTSTAATDRQNELVQLAQRRFAAFFEGDKTAYEQLVAKDAVFAYSSGRTLNYVEAVSELAPLAKAGTYSFHYEDVKIRDFATAPYWCTAGCFTGRLAAQVIMREWRATLSLGSITCGN